MLEQVVPIPEMSDMLQLVGLTRSSELESAS
jgi:hypothetical protein